MMAYHRFLLRGMSPMCFEPPHNPIPITDVIKLQIKNLKILCLSSA